MESQDLKKQWTNVNADGSTTLRLRFPVKHGEQEISELLIKAEMTAADMEAMDEADGPAGKGIALLAKMANVSPAVVRKLRAVDFVEGQKVVNDLMGKEPSR